MLTLYTIDKMATSDETMYIVYKLFAEGYKPVQTKCDISREYFISFLSKSVGIVLTQGYIRKWKTAPTEETIYILHNLQPTKVKNKVKKVKH